MNLRRLAAASFVLAFAGTGASARTGDEDNAWPLRVTRTTDAGHRWEAGGPLAFRYDQPDGTVNRGFRPFWVEQRAAAGGLRRGHLLYPLFSYTSDGTTYRWSLFELLRGWDRHAGAPVPAGTLEARRQLDVFPLWFSRQSGDPAADYQAFFPFRGTLRHRFGFERLSWTLFPLHVENERRGSVTTYTPWPFVRVTRGATEGGGFWPLYHYRQGPGGARADYWLWPLGYHVRQPAAADAPAGTPAREDLGVLPFYAVSTGPGFTNRDYLWPLFGRTVRTQPKAYEETRYLWPFLVQARGEGRAINRWAPLYTHSVNGSMDKTWVLWPLWREARWIDGGILRERTQLLYFLIWNETQRAASGRARGEAGLTHLWPFVSHWQDASGHEQWQAPSPLEVFFPGNPRVREAWNPLFALVRHEASGEGASRTTLLWNAISWEQREAGRVRSFHLGPLLSVESSPGEGRLALGRGLAGLRRQADGRWRPFWFDFSPPAATAGPVSR